MAWTLFDRQSYFGLSRRQLQTLYLVAATGLAALVPLILFAGFWVQWELGKGRRDLDTFVSARANGLSQKVDAEVERQLTALKVLAAAGHDLDPAQLEAGAGRVASGMAKWKNLTLVEAGGRVVFASDRSVPPPDATLVARTARTGQTLIEATEASGDVLILEPVKRGGTVTHVFVLDLDAVDIGSALTLARGQDLITFIVDDQGRVLARSSSAAEMPRAAADELVARVRPGELAGLFRYKLADGEPATIAFQRSNLTGWTSIVAISGDRGAHLFLRPVWATLSAGVLSLFLAGILAVFVTHNFMERRVSEERLAASHALGELDARLLATSQEALSDQRRSASEREVLLREIYHRVKNNLQIVQSLLRLGSRDLTTDQREPFENAVRRIGAMSRVHNLLYNSPDLASIDFKDYLEELLRDLQESFAAEGRSIEVVLRSDPMRMPLDTAVPLAFVAVEILTNSFKHAFPDGRPGRITVDVRRNGNDAELAISDNGVGVTPDPSGRRRLGLTIVGKLVQQIGGEFEEPPAGSSVFVIRFPIGTEPARDDGPA